MKNREDGVPNSRALAKLIMLNKFPEDRPIFWGPGQATRFPSEYAEPDPGFTHKSPVINPRVVRFHFGQHASTNVDRTIYLGKCNASVVRYKFATENLPRMPIRECTWFQQFQFAGEEIATEYGANMTTLELLGLHMANVSGACGKDNSFIDAGYVLLQPFFSLDYVGEVRSVYPDPPYDSYSIVDFVWNTGTPVIEPNHTVDLSGTYPPSTQWPGPTLEVLWRYIQTAGVTPGYVFQQTSRRSKTLHIYLRNIISGVTQTNQLFAAAVNEWNSPEPVTPSPFYSKMVTGLILEP